MKIYQNTRILAQSCFVLLCLTLAIGQAKAQTTYQWYGTTSTNWGTVANWSSSTMGPTNGTYNARLNVNSGANSPLVYTAAQGTTVYASSNNRGVVIGSATSTSSANNGQMNIIGGTFSTMGTAAQDVIGNNNTGTLIVNGGNFISPNLAFGTGGGGAGFLNISNGTATITLLAYYNVNSGTSGGTVELAGGTLTVSNIQKTSSSPYNYFNFDGGTLKPFNASSLFFPNVLARANVRNGGAVIDTAGYNQTIAQPLLHSTVSGDAALDGGLTKKGSGTLTLSSAATYTGPTVVNGGGLVEPFPQTSSGLTLASGATFNPALTNSPWFMASAALTNAYLGFNYGSWSVNSYTNTVYYVTNLAVSGSVTCNISGTGFPVTNLTLLTYGSKSGGGSFVVGTLPTGAAANIIDTGSSIVLQITSASIQNLVWSGGDGIWQTNGGLDWNSGTATYLEYPSGISDLVTFNDTSSGTVNINSQVKPTSTTVSVNSSSYNFTGTGHIGGTNGIAMTGTGTLTVGTSNNFSGPVTISGGSGTSGGFLYVNNSSALGDTNGTTTVNGPANTLEIGTASGAGVGVTNETVILTGTGVGGARGALRGAATASGANVWAGPVMIAANLSRIGTEDSGNLTVAGPVSDNGLGYSVLLRPGTSGVLTMAATGSGYGSTIVYDPSGSVVLGANNGISTNELMMEYGSFDLNSFNQTVGGVGDYNVSGPITIINNGASPAALTINTGTNSFSSSSSYANGTSQLALVKQGSGSQTLSSASLTYSGNTTVSQGQLILPNAASMASSITVQGGATLSGQITTSGALTLNANSILVANPAVSPTYSVASLNATASPLNVSFSSAPTPGVDVLILTASGGITGSAANFHSLGVRGGTFSLQNGNTELHYTAATGSTTITWAGNNSLNPTFWDVATTTNWNNAGNPDIFYTGDNVVFDDTGLGTNVTIQGSLVAPGSVTFSNSANNYVVSGGAISGSTPVLKTGTGKVTLTIANTYTGGTVISAGTIVVQNNTALGSVTGLVAITNGGTLDLGGTIASGSFNLGAQVLTVSGAGVGGNGAVVNNSANTQINAVQQMALADNASIGGLTRWDMRGTGNGLNMNGFNLTKTGTNYVALVATTIINPGNIDIVNGTLGIQLSAYLPGSANTLTVESNGILEFYQSTAPPSWTLVLNTNATVMPDAGSGSQNQWAGPVTLNGPATLLDSTVFGITGDISGTGSITNSGTGKTTLSGNTYYTGSTTVSGGSLFLTGNATLADSSVITVGSGATLDVTGITFTNSLGQILAGSGTVNGSVTANGTVAPGSATIGTLTFNNNLTLNGNLLFKLNKSLVQSNDLIKVTGALTNGGSGTLTVTNIGANALVVGDYFKLFNTALTNGSAFAISGPAGTTFTNNLALDGSISVLTVPPTTPPTLNFTSISGNQLQFTWAGSGKLQSQTNNLSTGLSTNWGDYPGGATSPVTVTVDPSQGSVFFRVKQ